ncbi:MAG: hypothetical protein FWC16_05955 [Defluviitaleaceae bacterium]|nr:hypothetical protein [Defluviitaleaceae bacterium]MCL2274452.1 hypothetical protein [Defluviitaleaceae bacterium]
MNNNDIKQMIFDAVQENRAPEQKSAPRHKKNERTFSQKIMAFSCVLYGLTWVACIVSWFWQGIFPEDLKSMATWLFGATFAFYEAKSCIENKSKIEINRIENEFNGG